MVKNVKLNCIEPLKQSGDPIIIYSLTEEAEAIANACRDAGLSVKAFCDNEIRKTNNSYCGLEVIYTPDLPKRFSKANFIIAYHALDDCAEQLSDLGYCEFYSPLELLNNYHVDKYSHRTAQSYMKKKIANAIKINECYFDESKTYLRSLDVVITTKCSMNCESCANLMQFYKFAKNTDDEILKSVKIISENVDHISEYRIIGGEPMMNKKWAEIINGVLDQDPNRTVYVYTNATICPTDEQLETFHGKNVHFYITDYGKLSRNIDRVVEALDKHGIGYYRRPAGNWVDCSTIRKHNRTAPRLKQIFQECCAKQLYTLLNGRLYTCPFIANAANLNAILDNNADYVDLSSDSDKIKSKIKRLVKKQSFFPACDFCDGRPRDPAKALEYAGRGLIKAAKQIPMSTSLSFEEYT